MSNMFFNAVSGSMIKNGSSISFTYGKRNTYYFNKNTSIFVDMTDVNNKYKNRFDNNILLNFLSSDGFVPVTPTTTPTQTITPGLSPTSSITPTVTPTNTLTPTSTQTSTVTITPTNTITNTVTPTNTATNTGTPTVTPTPSQPAIITNSANFNNCGGRVSSVGTNGRSSFYGTYDMSGNIWEWIETSVGLDNKVFRGGNWGYNSGYLSSAFRNYGSINTRNEYLGFRIASYSVSSYYSNMVYVSDLNNTADTTGYGSVSYAYYIGAYEITNNEYVEFLNSIAQTDTNSLYLSNMSFATNGGINRSGSVDNYIYSVKTNMGNKPVNFINWFNCARYCNWLHNGKPSGNQDNSTTENGCYDMSFGIPTRLNNATFFIPNENEWYKAAYYKGGSSNAGYWLYATQSNTEPSCVQLTQTGDGIPV